MPGKTAIRICPDFLGHIGKPGRIIAITGTNGKTTTTNLIADILEQNGYHIISNRLGGNINAGVASCLLNGVNMLNRPRADIAVLEVDERSSLKIYAYVQPDFLVCTNLARDSFRRNAHPYYIFDIINQALPTKTKLILNADDLISSGLGDDHGKYDPLISQRTAVYYGIDHLPDDYKGVHNIVNDAQVCPLCQNDLVYDYTRYNQIGHAHCPVCGLENHTADYHISSIDYDTYEVTVHFPGHTEKTSMKFPLISDSIFNIYNELSVITLLTEFGLSREDIYKGLANTEIIHSRFYTEEKKGITVESISTKGWIAPAVSAVFDYVRKQEGRKEIILMIEDLLDNENASENISWIFDTDFEFLNQSQVSQIIVIGKRVWDFQLRMQAAAIPDDKIIRLGSPAALADHLKLEPGSRVDIIYGLYQAENYQIIHEKVMDTIDRRNI